MPREWFGYSWVLCLKTILITLQSIFFVLSPRYILCVFDNHFSLFTSNWYSNLLFGDIFFSVSNFWFIVVPAFQNSGNILFFWKLVTDCSIFIDPVSSQIITIMRDLPRIFLCVCSKYVSICFDTSNQRPHFKLWTCHRFSNVSLCSSWQGVLVGSEHQNAVNNSFFLSLIQLGIQSWSVALPPTSGSRWIHCLQYALQSLSGHWGSS